MVVLSEAVGMVGFLLVREDDFRIEPDAAAVLVSPGALPALVAAIDALEATTAWTHAAIESALRESLVVEMGLKPKQAFGPVRAAVTGRRVSPPLFESMELLGRDRSLARLRAAHALAAGTPVVS